FWIDGGGFEADPNARGPGALERLDGRAHGHRLAARVDETGDGIDAAVHLVDELLDQGHRASVTAVRHRRKAGAATANGAVGSKEILGAPHENSPSIAGALQVRSRLDEDRIGERRRETEEFVFVVGKPAA